MSDEVVFEGERICESTEYFCSIVADGGEVDGDTVQLISALRTMASAVEQLREGPHNREVEHKLVQECTAIACHLLDKCCAVISN